MDIKYRDYSKSNISVFIEPVERDISQLDIEGITLTIPDEKECDRSYSGEETDNHWKRYMKQNTTIIDHLFTGFFKSTVSCTKCGAKSTSHDPFITLSIPSNYPTITQSLDYFF
jgi:ubiquitin C-terminal hydrolase